MARFDIYRLTFAKTSNSLWRTLLVLSCQNLVPFTY